MPPIPGDNGRLQSGGASAGDEHRLGVVGRKGNTSSSGRSRVGLMAHLVMRVW